MDFQMFVVQQTSATALDKTAKAASRLLSEHAQLIPIKEMERLQLDTEQEKTTKVATVLLLEDLPETQEDALTLLQLEMTPLHVVIKPKVVLQLDLEPLKVVANAKTLLQLDIKPDSAGKVAAQLQLGACRRAASNWELLLTQPVLQ